MYISRDTYDRKPFLIKQGALQLWGVPLAKRVDLCRVRELYLFNNFFAEICYDKTTGDPTCICSFTSYQRLVPYLEKPNLDALNQVDNQIPVEQKMD